MNVFKLRSRREMTACVELSFRIMSKVLQCKPFNWPICGFRFPVFGFATGSQTKILESTDEAIAHSPLTLAVKAQLALSARNSHHQHLGMQAYCPNDFDAASAE